MLVLINSIQAGPGPFGIAGVMLLIPFKQPKWRQNSFFKMFCFLEIAIGRKPLSSARPSPLALANEIEISHEYGQCADLGTDTSAEPVNGCRPLPGATSIKI